ncbi:GDSL-type esterase/lipase family protein [Acetobacterium woodii]|uniref:Lipase GDSL family n=1 Tax=Acetobacterium woodii (strain ATCC 29683 / DSM 1030 / JCM 2381 / KCTC 1655 / WB1) TaxID=931626 RepID=H6LGP1_ACEWD|nr:GDSL-type esterase/lipase family protein [Acetobacterium woodii]AFA48369.1 lipase GDSL family [Acetobacterium woodii DSM 1030]
MKIICLGDSLTFGYQVPRELKWHVIAARKTGIQLVNRGISGETTDGMLVRIKRQVFDAKPEGVIIMGGYNDIFFNRSWERAAENMKTMVAQSRVQKIQVYVAIPPPILLPIAFNEGGAEMVDFEKSALMIEDYCQWLKDFTITSQIPALDFRADIDWSAHDLYLDGIHQSPEGHRRMAERLIEFLKQQSCL